MNSKQKLLELYSNSLVCINGKITSAEDAKVSVFDRGFLYGDSIYEVAYSKDGKLIFFEDHLDRLYKSANLLNIQIYESKEDLIKQCLNLLKELKKSQAYLRIIITRGETEITLDPSNSFHNNIILIAKPKPTYNKQLYKEGIRLCIVSIMRNDPRSTNPNAKSGNYLNNVLAINEAKRQNFDDALMLNNQGYITEGSSFNVWMVKDNVLITPPEESGLLKGITREKLFLICKENNIDYKEENIRPDDIICADEAFITSSTRMIMPIGIINNTNILKDGNPTTQKLQLLFREYIKQECTKSNFNYL